MKTALRLTVVILLLAVSSLAATTHYVSLESTNPTPPYTNWVTAATNITQAVNVAASGDRVVVTNGVYSDNISVFAPLTLLSVNGPQFTVINGGSTGPCVILNDGASVTGFTLTNGIASGGNGGGVSCASTNSFLTNCVIVGNRVTPTLIGWGGCGGGVYGGTLYQCTLSGNQAVARRVSSPWPPYYTQIYGYGGGAYGSVLHVCTVGDNSAENGSGVYESTLYNCTLDGNSSYEGGVYGLGGGAYQSTLYDCTLTHNTNTYGGGACYGTLYNCILTANYSNVGGGAAYATLDNCTLTANSAGPRSGLANGEGGGVYGGTLRNCTLTGNSVNEAGDTATNGANYDNCTLNYCCTMPLPTDGVGNIVLDPLFVDYANGNLHLQSNSPCINSGNNAYVSGTTDLDGRPRIVGGTVDMGAYEFQPGVSGAFIGWLQHYGLPTDGSADYADPDRDGMDNWQEWICGTCPTNPASALCLLSATPQGTNVTVTWQSVAGVNYLLGRSTKLGSPFTLVATNIVGQAGITSYADPNATGAGPLFYRVGVKLP